MILDGIILNICGNLSILIEIELNSRNEFNNKVDLSNKTPINSQQIGVYAQKIG